MLMYSALYLLVGSVISACNFSFEKNDGDKYEDIVENGKLFMFTVFIWPILLMMLIAMFVCYLSEVTPSLWAMFTSNVKMGFNHAFYLVGVFAAKATETKEEVVKAIKWKVSQFLEH